MKLWALLADTRASMRECLSAEFGLREDAGMAQRLMIARLLSSWETAKRRMEVRVEQKALSAAQQLPELLSKTEHNSLRRAFEAQHYPLEEKTTPADSYVEYRFDQIEQGEMRAETLQMTTSKSDTAEDPLGATVDPRTGMIRIKKGAQEIPLPRNPEEFRARIRVLGHCWLIAAIKFPNKAWLRTATPQLFQEYVDFLLGEHVWNSHSKDAAGNVVASPLWSTFLSYEIEIRKLAAKLINEGLDIATAFRRAMNEPVTFARFFTTPTVRDSVSQQADFARGSRERSRSPRGGQGHSSGKGKSKGNKGGKSKSKKGDLHAKTPDGRSICYKYNNASERCRGQCPYVHVCRRCFGAHPMHMCKGETSSATKDDKNVSKTASA
jgi:hypothetical protein